MNLYHCLFQTKQGEPSQEILLDIFLIVPRVISFNSSSLLKCKSSYIHVNIIEESVVIVFVIEVDFCKCRMAVPYLS